jgi:hypothetical protein
MPRDPYVREKFTREHGEARRVAREYFVKYPKDRYQTEVESLAPSAIEELRVHDEAAARAEGLKDSQNCLLASPDVQFQN